MKNRAVRVTSGHKEFEVLPGYSFSINIYEAGLFLCANVKAKVMPKHNVLDVIKVTHLELSEDPQKQCLPPNIFQEHLRKEVVRRIAGIQVRTMYNNKTYRVDDVDFRYLASN